MEFLVWETGYDPGICSLTELENVDDDFELTFGASRIAGWPNDALCRMNPRRKRDVGLADCLDGAMVLVISGKLKQALEREKVDNVEFLPIIIVGHKGRSASGDYFICNPQHVVDCIDEAGSKVKRNKMDPGAIVSCERLVLRNDAIPPGIKLLRPERWRDVVLIRRDLANKLESEGLTGLYFTECNEFSG